jgi:hypothetical protein
VETFINPRRNAVRFLLLASVLEALSGASAKGQTPAADEVQIRAAMVFNLTRYVDWPAWKFVDPATPVVICFVPKDPVGDDVDMLIRDRQAHDKQGQDRAIVVRRVSSVAASDTCHVLYASRSDRKKFGDASSGLAKAAVLTISDQQTPSDGPVISLPLIDKRVQILVNLRVAQQSGLTLSSKLLRIATVTR